MIVLGKSRNAEIRLPPSTHPSAQVYYVVEPCRPGSEHLSFNAAALRQLLDGLGADRLHFFCARSHLRQLIAFEPVLASVPQTDIPVVTGFSRSFARKFTIELWVISRILWRARAEGAVVLLLSVFPNVLAILMKLEWLFGSVDLHVILHGEVESLLQPEKRGIHRLGFWTRLALLQWYRGRWPQLHVLGLGIRTRLLARFPDHPQLGSLKSLEHPYIFHAVADQRGGVPRAYRVGFVGSGRAIKGINEFYRMANAFAAEAAKGLVEFVVVGGVDERELTEISGVVQVLADRPTGLAGQRYMREIRALDCALFLYRQDYQLTASGAVFDVVDAGVEILSLPNSYLADVATGDREGGFRFAQDEHQIEIRLRERIQTGPSPARFEYPEIKVKHSTAAARALLQSIAGEYAGEWGMPNEK